MTMHAKTFLSKSRYIRGLQCQKSLYLYTYHPELRDEITDDQQAVFGIGTDVGILARSLFPGGIEIPFDGLSIPEQLEATAYEIDKGTPILYEAAFNANGIFIKADIMKKGDDGWEIYEVKSSTSMKDLYFQDVGVQYHVLKGAGLPISKAFVVFINNQYVRNGNLDIPALFNIQDVTEEVQGKEIEVEQTVLTLKKMLRGPCPEIDVGSHCDNPYPCDFKGHCWASIPEDSVLYIKGRGTYKLYSQGFKLIQDVPLTALSDAQQMQVLGTLEKRDFINKDNIKAFLQTLHYPLCFLDFETVMSAIPPFDGVRPYQQIPFQFSLHIQEQENTEAKHYEFLADPSEDYREKLLQYLLSLIPENSCILAYNMTFEVMCLNALASWFLQSQARIEKVIGQFRDLMAPFKSRDLYHHKMNGSYSLKMVLPALIPEMNYEELEIQEGGMASTYFLKLAQTQDKEERKRLHQALLDYCEQDTWAMVKILEKLKLIVS
jgi:hypothetical protein